MYTLRIATGDSVVPYLVLYQDGSYYTVHDLDGDNTGVYYATSGGDKIYFVMDGTGKLVKAKINNYLLAFNYVDQYTDISITDQNGSFFDFYSVDMNNIQAKYLNVTKKSSSSDSILDMVNNALSYLGNVISVAKVFNGGIIEDFISSNLRDIVFPGIVYGMAGDDEWGKAVKDSFDVVYSAGLCVLGNSTSCLSAIVSMQKNLVNAIEEGFKTVKEIAYYAEMERQFEEREKDKDGDGYSQVQRDCDDANITIHPHATEICDDNIDQDCDKKDSITDKCGVCGGTNACLGCDLVPNSGKVDDQCGVCDGDNSTCTDCFGTVNGEGYKDGCGTCRIGVPPLAPCVCGDGDLAVSGEECDDGDNDNGDGCSATCKLEGECGDGVLASNEKCDDGNTYDGDGCSGDCTKETIPEWYYTTSESEEYITYGKQRVFLTWDEYEGFQRFEGIQYKMNKITSTIIITETIGEMYTDPDIVYPDTNKLNQVLKRHYGDGEQNCRTQYVITVKVREGWDSEAIDTYWNSYEYEELTNPLNDFSILHGWGIHEEFFGAGDEVEELPAKEDGECKLWEPVNEYYKSYQCPITSFKEICAITAQMTPEYLIIKNAEDCHTWWDHYDDDGKWVECEN
jgi:cysteine-rich repeat protein